MEFGYNTFIMILIGHGYAFYLMDKSMLQPFTALVKYQDA
ncbi:hypothetical protein K013_1986 [Acinetobacter baumannii 25569_7]|nr:hypothetical protein K013_1986 [Acinetobacter baumannii 25569_7]